MAKKLPNRRNGSLPLWDSVSVAPIRTMKISRSQSLWFCGLSALALAFTAGCERQAAAAAPAAQGEAATTASADHAEAAEPAEAVPNNLPVFGGLLAAAVFLGCAFWMILKGGQQAAG